LRLSDDEFQGLFQSFERSAVRIETLPTYVVEDEQAEFARYLAGEVLPDLEDMKDWLDGIRASAAAGRAYERIRLLPKPISPYFRFELDWGYLYSVSAGETVRIARPGSPAYQAAVQHGDFWLFDERRYVNMLYASDGRYVGAEEVDMPSEVPGIIHALRDEAMALAEYLKVIRTEI
jgi:hypothetical protein